MKRIILSALVALTAFGGVASADRWRGDTRHAPGGVTVTPSRGYYQQGPRYQRERPRHYNRGYVTRPMYRYRYVRRPIFVQRPVAQYRYYDYYQRPAVVAESYNAMPGYYWVAGQWTWSGYEWVWQPGHYEPDPNAQGYYSNTAGSSYCDNPQYDSSYSYDNY